MNSIDLTQKVPVLSILFMFISAAAVFIVPFYLYRKISKKHGADIFCVPAGAVTYVIFGILAVQVLGGIIFIIPGAVSLLEGSRWMQAFYYLLLTSLTEIVGILTGVALIQKKHGGEGRALAFGLGYGSGKAVLMAGPAILANIRASIEINTSGLSSIAVKAGAEGQTALLETFDTLLKGRPFGFLWIGIEQSAFTLFYCAAALLLWMILVKKMPLPFIGVLFVLFFCLLLPFVLFSYGIFKDQLQAMVMFLLTATGVLFVGQRLIKRYFGDVL